MIDFLIPEGKNSPHVQFFSKEHRLVISGKSFPENAKKFYEEVYQHLVNHSFNSTFQVLLDLDYVSSSSVIGILELLKRISAFTKLDVEFTYEDGDDDMLNVGENYQKVLGMEFKFTVK